ncbi:MAG: hypothetical protein IKH96_09000 [Ruminococcus sp.]|uniref:hypothetical protein n=1 Tax=Ruminococcus sp. TaxID=41978 RepID=UPI0025D7CE31|nr:hypothetical protein [Ruminococcus sp.]MBR6996139.1 hypothetical protein [Ruminococcus sp.]
MIDRNNKLLYRIDEKQKNVEFLITDEIDNVFENNIQESTIIICFDDVLKSVMEIRNISSDYKQCIIDAAKTIDNSKALFMGAISLIENNKSNSSNFFIRYYSTNLYNLSLKERNKVRKASYIPLPPLFDYVVKKTSNNLYNEYDQIHNVLFNDAIFNISGTNEQMKILLNKNTVHLIDNDHNEMYTIADELLVNFFDDFSYTLHKQGLNICQCKYCNKLFIDKKHKDYCNAEECQTVYKNEKKSTKRHRKPNDPCKNPKKTIRIYFAGKKVISVMNSPKILKYKKSLQHISHCFIKK